jgi:hypothetical protein
MADLKMPPHRAGVTSEEPSSLTGTGADSYTPIYRGDLMEKRVRRARAGKPENDVAEFDAAATRLEKRLDKLGVTEKDLLDAAARVRERMLTEIYALGVEARHG